MRNLLQDLLLCGLLVFLFVWGCKLIVDYYQYDSNHLVIFQHEEYVGCGYQIEITDSSSSKALVDLSIIDEIKLPITPEQFNQDHRQWVEICRQLGKMPFWDKPNTITQHSHISEVHFVYPKQNTQ